MNNGVILVGNPNCGKTTLYNLLTGRSEKVGNRAGVTVESKTGRYKKNRRVAVTDLPGMYSTESGSPDEKIARENVLSYSQTIINVVDGLNLERNLRLTCELTRLNKPMVIAVNFCDELKKNGVKIDVNALGARFGVPAVLISARKNTGIDALMSAALGNARKPVAVSAADAEKFIADTALNALTRAAVKKESFTDKADKILMHPVLGIPIFAAVILCAYFLTSAVGGYFGDGIARAFIRLGAIVKNALENGGSSTWFSGLITGAVLKGVGTVLSFLPQVLVLFFLLEIIEESGYLARAAFLMDGIMERIGLGGKSLIAMGVSCGCAVNGIMTSRTLDDENARRLTVYLCPFMPCGAKTAVFAWFSGLLFGGNPLICASLYFLSIISVAVFGAVLKRFKRFRGKNGLVMEIPVLRAPSLRGVLGALKEKTADFLLKAGSVIFLVSVAVWFLQSFGINGYAADIKDSFLFLLGDKIKIVFVPLGFGKWETAVAYLASVFAKESVIQTLSMVSENPAKLFPSGAAAYSFMAFILLSPPCAAALSAAYRELKSVREFCFMTVFQTAAAYTVALSINVLGTLLQYAVLWIPLTIVAGGIIISIVILVKRRGCAGCRACGGEKCRTKKANTTI